MCGRMTLTRSAAEIVEFFEIPSVDAAGDPAIGSEIAGPDGGPWRPLYNIAPSQPVLTVVLGQENFRRLAWKRWGLVPAWAKDPAMGGKLFNARSETVSEKPSFRSAFKRRRCLVAADGFYEWTPRNRGHRAHWLHPRSGTLLALAGLYEQWALERGPVIETCTVLTTEANGDLAAIHTRMPLILARESWSTWLDPESEPESLKRLLRPAPDATLAARGVSSHVNDPRHDDPSCLADLAPAAEFRLDGGSSR